MPPPNNKSMMMNTRPGRIGGDSDESETPSNNLWVGNLASDIADSDLMDLFVQYGALDSVTSYSSRSYAFVFFKRIEDAKAAKDTLQGADLHGHPIKIEFARPVCSHQFVLLLCIYINTIRFVTLKFCVVFYAFQQLLSFNLLIMIPYQIRSLEE